MPDVGRHRRNVAGLHRQPGTRAAAGQPGPMRQLLHNLLTNAVEALEGQVGGEVAVTTRLAGRDGGEVVAVLIPGIKLSIRTPLIYRP